MASSYIRPSLVMEDAPHFHLQGGLSCTETGNMQQLNCFQT